MPAKIKPNSNRGGARPGAGRPPKIKASLTTPWEAAEQFQPGRHYIYLPQIEARRDFGQTDRRTLLQKGWWLYHNLGLPRRAINGVARYTVGTGLLPQARTADDDWNDNVEAEFFRQLCNVPWAFDAAGGVNFLESQTMVLRHAGIAGDIFAQPTLSQAGRALWRFIPGENVGNSYLRRNGFDEDQWHDGVRTDPATGRPIAFRILTDANGSEFEDVQAQDIMHIRRIHRLGYTRGVSWLAAAANHLQDMAEMTGFTKQSFKLAAQVGFVLATNDAGKVAMGNAITYPHDSGNGLNSRPGVARDSVYSASGIPQIKPNERLESFTNPHPGETYAPFMQYLARDIAWSMDISPEILWDITQAGGANTRYALADAQVFFEDLRAWLVNSYCRNVYTYWLWHEIEAERIPYREDWALHEWSAPPDVTVDFGRDTKTLLEVVRNGGISPKRFGQILGFDEDKEEKDIIAAQVRRRKLIAEANKALPEGTAPITYADCFDTAKAAAAPAPPAAAEPEPPEPPPAQKS